jgi:dTDP-4-amino-4,6-dideoxygalactose transaminase
MHACKLLNGFGGGYLTTNNSELARKLSLMRGFGFDTVDHIAVPNGLNAKLNEMHAAMALASLDDVEAQVERNRERYCAYKALLREVPGVRLLEFDERHRTGYKNIVVELLPEWPLSRAHTIGVLNAEGILARAYYAPPLHRKPMAYPHVPGQLPESDALAEKFLNLPCGHFVTVADIAEIVHMLEFLSANAKAVSGRLELDSAA